MKVIEEIKYQVKYSVGTQTVWVNVSDGSCVGRFSKRFGMDIHTTVDEQLQGKPQCLHCTHGKPTENDLQFFIKKAEEYWGVKIDQSKF